MPPSWAAPSATASAPKANDRQAPLPTRRAITGEGVVLRGWLFGLAVSDEEQSFTCTEWPTTGVVGGHSLCATSRAATTSSPTTAAPRSRAVRRALRLFRERRICERPLISGVTDVAVIGGSMGAAVGLQAAADDTRIQKVVSIATFSDLRTVARERAPFFASEKTSTMRSRWPSSKATSWSTTSARRRRPPTFQFPVLVVHGADDHDTRPAIPTRVPALKGPKRLFASPGRWSFHAFVGGHLEDRRRVAGSLSPFDGGGRTRLLRISGQKQARRVGGRPGATSWRRALRRLRPVASERQGDHGRRPFGPRPPSAHGPRAASRRRAAAEKRHRHQPASAERRFLRCSVRGPALLPPLDPSSHQQQSHAYHHGQVPTGGPLDQQTAQKKERKGRGCNDGRLPLDREPVLSSSNGFRPRPVIERHRESARPLGADGGSSRAQPVLQGGASGRLLLAAKVLPARGGTPGTGGDHSTSGRPARHSFSFGRAH